jgi:LysM repeat protein
MKYSILSLICVLLAWHAAAQQTPALVIQEAGRLSLPHTVASKENWYSLGRMYNVSPQELTAFNRATLNDMLSNGQSLRIPLTATNFAQEGQPAGDEVFVPLYHQVKEKEGLFRIGQDHGKVSPDQLRGWNNLQGDAIQPGMNLVVGYLRVKKSQSPLASGGQSRVTEKTVAGSEQKPPSVNPPPAEKKDAVARAEDKKPPQSQVNPPATEKKETVVRSEDKKPPQSQVNPPAESTQPVRNVAAAAGTSDSPGGFFRSLHETQSAAGQASSITGMVASFKSTSGWKDAKYYALMNEVAPGTVVKFTHAATGNFVYAKVLGELPAIRENEGLVARLSNASLSALSLEEGKHELKLGWTRQ